MLPFLFSDQSIAERTVKNSLSQFATDFQQNFTKVCYEVYRVYKSILLSYAHVRIKKMPRTYSRHFFMKSTLNRTKCYTCDNISGKN